MRGHLEASHQSESRKNKLFKESTSLMRIIKRAQSSKVEEQTERCSPENLRLKDCTFSRISGSTRAEPGINIEIRCLHNGHWTLLRFWCSQYAKMQDAAKRNGRNGYGDWYRMERSLKQSMFKPQNQWLQFVRIAFSLKGRMQIGQLLSSPGAAIEYNMNRSSEYRRALHKPLVAKDPMFDRVASTSCCWAGWMPRTFE